MNKFAAVDVRFLLLAAMLVFLPGIEALKNIFALLFVFSWVMVAKKNKDWGGKWRVIDSIFLLWILGDIFVSINAVISHQLPGSDFRDILRFVLIAWVLTRIDFSNEKISQLAIIAVLSTLATLIYSYYSTGGILKELNSVGHINHTAIFLVIAYSISLSLLLFNFANINNYQKIVLLISTVVLFYTTLDTGSRAVFGLLIFNSLLGLLYVIIKSRKFILFFLFLGLIFSICFFWSQNPPKALERISEVNILQILQQDTARKKIRNFSYFAFLKNPLLGIGFGNYGQMKHEDIKSVIIKHKGVYDSSQFLTSSHAHNIYFNYLVSGGLVMFSILMWFWFYIFWVVYKLRSNIKNQWIVSCSIFVALINLGIGWVNTTLHNEHAILSMFILGLLISKYRKFLENIPFKNSETYLRN